MIGSWKVLAIIALSGCASSSLQAPLSTPIIVYGIVTRPMDTDWARDICSYNQLVRAEDRSDSASCVPMGGEIFSAELLNARQVNGQPLAGSLQIGFPGHALATTFRQSTYLVLQTSPPAFRADTGIDYVATEYGNYDASRKCLTDLGHAHLNNRQCPDKAFHERNKDRCIPVDEYLSHHAGGL